MIKRQIVIPARFLPLLDQALDRVIERIQSGEIEDWMCDQVRPEVMMTLTVERPEPALRLERAG